MQYCTMSQQCYFTQSKLCCHECDMKTTCKGACKLEKATCKFALVDRSMREDNKMGARRA